MRQRPSNYNHLNLPVLEIGCICSGYWSKGSHGDLQTTQSIPMAIGCSIQTYDNVLLPKTPSAQFIDHEEV